MKFISTLIAVIALLTAPLIPGCTTGPTSAERISEKSIAASNSAVDTALKAFYLKYATQEADNDATRASDPGGYLERQNALLRKHGAVTTAHEKYKLAVNLAIESWIATHGQGSGDGGQSIPSTTAVTSAFNELNLALQ